MIPPLGVENFLKVESLNLSYNQISPASIRNLYTIKRLKSLDLSGNNILTLPDDLSQLRFLEELNISSNLFSSSSTIVNPSYIFKTLG
jgi:Leucine-rich repeat (LRR) protein